MHRGVWWGLVGTIPHIFFGKKDRMIALHVSRESSIDIVRDGGGSGGAAARGQAEGHGREEHAQPLPEEHGRTHPGDQEPLTRPQPVSRRRGEQPAAETAGVVSRI